MRAVPKAIWAILALALVLRLGAIELLTGEFPPGADERAYATIAASIADGNGFPDRVEAAGGGPSAANPPGYPYALGALFWATGDSVDVARIVQAVLGTVTVGMLGLLAFRLFGDRRVAIAATGIAAVYPPLIVIGVPLMTESLLFGLLLGMALAALRFREAGGFGWAALAGGLGGAAVLTKDVGAIAFLVVLFAVWGRPRLRFASLRAPALALVVAVAITLPWQIRNAVEFDSFVPVSTKLGLGLAGSYNDAVRADPEHVWAPPYQLAELRDLLYGTELDEAEVSSELQSRSLDYIGDHPGYPPALAYRNARRMLQLQTSPLRPADAELLGFEGAVATRGEFEVLYWICAGPFFVLAALAAYSLLRGYARPIPAFLWVIAALSLLSLVFIAGGPRYRLPADLVLILAAAPVLIGARATGCSRG